MFKKHKKLLTFVFLVFILSIGGSYLYRQGIFLSSPIQLPVIIPSPTPKESRYESLKYGFSFPYPNNWEIKDWDLQDMSGMNTVPEGSIRFQVEASGDKQKFELLVWENRSNMEAYDWVRNFLFEEINRDNVPNDYNTTVSGIPSINFVNESLARNKPVEYIFFKKGPAIYELLFEKKNKEELSDEYINILDSFHIQ